MKKVTFLVGQTNNSGESLNLSAAQVTAFQYLTENFGGFTAIPIVGGWKDPVNGTMVIENSLRLEVFTDKTAGRGLENAAKFLRDTFKQEEVVFNVEAAEEFTHV